MRIHTCWLSFAALLGLALAAGGCADDETPPPIDGRPQETKCLVVDFGSRRITNEDPVEREQEFRNIGDDTILVGPLALAPPFSSDVPPNGLRVAPGAAATITFGFRPTVVGKAETTVSIDSREGGACVQLKGEGVAAAFTCEPSSVDFGNVEKGRIATREIECTNHTVLDMLVRVPDGMEGEDRDFFDYGAIRPEGVLVRAGDKLVVPVSFLAEGPSRERLARFTLMAGDEALATIELEGNTVASAIAVSPTCDQGGLQFGYVAPGAAVEKTLLVRNQGSDPLTVSALTLVAPDTAAFSLLTSAPLTIPADDPATTDAENEAEIVIRFEPSGAESMDAKSARLRIASNSNQPELDVCLAADARGPRLSCSPGSLDFGPVSIGVPATREYTCANDGFDAPDEPLLDNLFVETVATDHGEFTAQIRNADGTLGPKSGGYAAGERFTVAVTYAPVDTGSDEATIAITSNDLLTPIHDTAVQAEGRQLPPCSFAVFPPNLRYGIVAPGDSATLEFGVVNALPTECLITNLRISDDTAGAFTIEAPPSLVLPGAGTVRIPITFAPPAGAASAVFTGKVFFDISNAGSPHQEVSLRGASQEPCAMIAPRHLDFGSVGPNCSTLAREFTVVNVCTAPIAVTDITTNVGPSSEFEIRARPAFPATLARGERTTFTVVYAPQDLGEDLGSVLVHVDHDLDGDTADEEPYMATMEGRGVTDALQTDRFEQDADPKVDVLWVIDNSPEMAPFQADVAANLAAFLDLALAEQIDFHLGVTTMSGGCPVGGPVPGTLYSSGTTPQVLTPSTPNLAQAWANNVNVGTCNGVDRGLQAAELALWPGANPGFLRQDAELVVVFVSANPDQSPETTTYYYNYLISIKGFRNSNMFAAHAIVGDAGGCSIPGGGAADGSRYTDLAEASGGAIHSICSPDWSPALEQIAADRFGFSSRFFLANQPADSDGDGVISDRVNPAEIQVFIDGTLVSSRSGTQDVWFYEPTTNSVEFTPDHTPEPGALIEVTYATACLPPQG